MHDKKVNAEKYPKSINKANSTCKQSKRNDPASKILDTHITHKLVLGLRVSAGIQQQPHAVRVTLLSGNM
jgi:hypothetical protein